MKQHDDNYEQIAGESPAVTYHGQPYADHSLQIDLRILDPDMVAALSAYPEGRLRNDFIQSALRIGIAAFQQAEGQIDSQAVRNEGERLLQEMSSLLGAHRDKVTDQVSSSIKEYFDPNDGRFQERLKRLLEQDGELEQVLRQQVGSTDSALAKTLEASFGPASPIMKVLDPQETGGFLTSMQSTLDKALVSERETILGQFSLDEPSSALSRLVKELNDNHGKLTGNLQESIKDVVGEFSLDNEQSALSRLVKRVETAQKQISSEFSLDSEASALARMKQELLNVLATHKDESSKFQQDVMNALTEMKARKAESMRSTTHGNEFEAELFRIISEQCQQAGDIAMPTGNTTGTIRHSKVGDAVIQLGQEHAAAGARIVIEAKDSGAYDIRKALDEIEVARKNRAASVGVFVFSQRTAPQGMEAITRYGQDIFTLWDMDNSDSDVILHAAISLARALSTRHAAEEGKSDIDLDEMDRAIREVEKQVKGVGEIDTWATTIKNNSEKIINRTQSMKLQLERQIGVLDGVTSMIKQHLAGESA